jgi:beta-barrel assembly-enhancing protease
MQKKSRHNTEKLIKLRAAPEINSRWPQSTFPFAVAYYLCSAIRTPAQEILMRKLKLAVILSLLTTTIWAQGPSRFHPGFNLFSKQQDVQLGQEAAAQVRKQMHVINDPVLTDYVNRVGKRLASTPEARDSGFPFTFEVVADPSINAFALPGGPMFVNTGLLKAVDSEGELAGVMGHEMSHVILRHGTNQASKAELFQLGLAAGGFAGGGSMLGQLAQAGIGLGANSVLLKFSRNAESQADLMGSHIMAESGYNPLELARFFETLGSQNGSRGVQFFSDHPNPGNRERAIEEEVDKMGGRRNYTYQTGEFQRMKQEVAGIHEPPRQQQQRGYERGPDDRGDRYPNQDRYPDNRYPNDQY